MLSKKAKYGLKALIYLANLQGESPALIADIAAAERIPKKFLDMILLEMRNADILASRKGKGGGYTLAVPPERIFIGTVVRLLDGPLAPVSCVSKTAYRRCDDCTSEETCRIRHLMGRVRDAISEVLDTTTLADLARNREVRAFVMNYDI